jgi:integrase/recombinase XerD
MLVGLVDVLKDYTTFCRTKKQINLYNSKNNAYLVKKFIQFTGTLTPTEKQGMTYYEQLLTRGFKSSTINNNMYAVKHYFEMIGIPFKFKKQRQRQREIVFLNRDEIKRLLYSVDNYRNYAVILILLYGGLRVGEVCKLDLSDFNPEEKTLLIRDAKNFQDQKITLKDKAVEALKSYLERRPKVESNAIFITRRRDRISSGSIQRMVKMYAQRAGIQKKLTPHILRHTIATNLLLQGADITLVKRHLRHKSLSSTLIYLHMTDDNYKKLYDHYVPDF